MTPSFFANFVEQIKSNHNLSHLNWFKTGGKADWFFKPKDLQSLKDFLKQNDNLLPVTIIGAGSNILIRDGGIRGIVIKLGQGFNDITLNIVKKTISVGASCLNINLANFCLNHEIGGFEFLSGIPGSIGAGIITNAGAYGSEYKDILKSAQGINMKGEEVYYDINDLKLTYRNNGLEEKIIFTNLEFNIVYDDYNNIKNKMNKIQESRKATQPITSKTCGSIFKNPEGVKVWELIDRAGLKGHRIGDAQISALHNNFMINLGSATSSDLEDLGDYVQQKIFETTKIKLQWEIIKLGNKIVN